MSLARTWTLIAHHLDDRLDQLFNARRLSWMPAHQPPSSVGNVLKSTGAPITAIDWRANHLVDGLAKLAATDGATTHEEARLFTSAEHLVRHCAGQLAAATYAANKYHEQFIDANGITKTRVKRDSQDFPKSGCRKLKPLLALSHVPSRSAQEEAESSSEDSDSEQPVSFRQGKRAARAFAKLRERGQKKAALDSIVFAKRLNHREAVLVGYIQAAAAG